MKRCLFFTAIALLTLQGCSFRAVTVRTVPEPSPGIYVESCLDRDDCPGAVAKYFLTWRSDRQLNEEGFVDVSYFVSDMTGPGSVLRAGSALGGLTYAGNILDCVAINAASLRNQIDRKAIVDALTVEEEVMDMPNGRLRVTPGEFLRFERQDGIAEEYGRIRDVELVFENAKVYKESIDVGSLRFILDSLMPHMTAQCQQLTKSLGYLIVSSWRVEGLIYRPIRSRFSSAKVTEDSVTDFFLFPAYVRYRILEESGTVQILDKRTLLVGTDYLPLEEFERVPIPLEEAVQIYRSLYFK